MAETFNNFFVTIASDIDSKIIHTNTSYKDYLQDSVLKSFFLKPATEKEVISVINEMKTNKSTGPNSIPTHILKISNKIICKLLTYLINLLFQMKSSQAHLKLQMLFPYLREGKTKITKIIDQYH